MMIKNVLYILIIPFMTGCFGETNCPEYPESKLNWIPYQIDNVIKFSNNLDTIEFLINDTEISNAYSFENNCDCSCEAYAYFKTDINNIINIKIEGHSTFYGDRLNYNYTFIKYGGDFYSALRSDDFYFSFENSNTSTEIISEYQIENINYKNVVEIELDTIDDNSLNWRKPEIWRLLIADSVGIILFDDCKLRKTWVRIE